MVVIITKCNIKANIPFLIKKGTYMLVLSLEWLETRWVFICIIQKEHYYRNTEIGTVLFLKNPHNYSVHN